VIPIIMALPYSRIGRTRILNNLLSIVGSRYSKDLLINPSTQLALAAATEV